jgi:hypothetical protein
VACTLKRGMKNPWANRNDCKAEGNSTIWVLFFTNLNGVFWGVRRKGRETFWNHAQQFLIAHLFFCDDIIDHNSKSEKSVYWVIHKLLNFSTVLSPL